jgi:putative polyhydroxyalkanoate system protein
MEEPAMSTICVQQHHDLGRDQARAALKSFEDSLAKYRVKLAWSGSKADIKGTGVSGDVTVGDADVTVKVELGFLAKAAGVDPAKLEASIRRRLSEALQPEPPKAA